CPLSVDWVPTWLKMPPPVPETPAFCSVTLASAETERNATTPTTYQTARIEVPTPTRSWTHPVRVVPRLADLPLHAADFPPVVAGCHSSRFDSYAKVMRFRCDSDAQQRSLTACDSANRRSTTPACCVHARPRRATCGIWPRARKRRSRRRP